MRIIFGLKESTKKIEIYLTRDEASRLRGTCREIIEMADKADQMKYTLNDWIHNGDDDINYCRNCALFTYYYSDKIIDSFSEHVLEIIRKDL